MIGVALSGATDVTFFAVSDTHYGGYLHDSRAVSSRASMPAILNSLPGSPYPDFLGGGIVGMPRGILVAGDLIDNLNATAWDAYAKVYGVNGEGQIHYPVFDGLGNHDYYPTEMIPDTGYLVKKMISRNELRKGSITNSDEAGYNYSWEWDDVHFVNLNIYGGSANTIDFRPQGSLDFLVKDLSEFVGTSGRPVFIMQHFPVRDDIDYPPALRRKLWDALRGYNVIGILHGHSHNEAIYQWILDGDTIDVFDDGAVVKGDQMVFHITDGRMRVGTRIDNNWNDKLKLDKPIQMGSPRIPPPAIPQQLNSDSMTVNRHAIKTSPSIRYFVMSSTGWSWRIPSSARNIDILDLKGRLIRSLRANSASVKWDGRDRKGRPVRGGVYILHASPGPHTKVILP